MAKLIRSIWAGIFIGIGATALMGIQVPIVGSLFFALGLLSIIHLKLSLYTGAIGYLKDTFSFADMGVIYLGNVIGTCLYGTCLKLSNLGIAPTAILAKKGVLIANMPDVAFHILFASFMCGVLMYTAVAVWKETQNVFSNALITVLCVSVFILSGFEHCIANMVYLFAGNCDAPILDQVLFIALVTLGNSLGSIAFHRSRKLAA